MTPASYRLRPYQSKGVEYLIKTKRVILGDEMGLGKTPQALVAIGSMNAYPLIIVCPVTLCEMWRLACEEWLGFTQSQVLVIRPNVPIERGYKIYIIGYSIVDRYKDEVKRLAPVAVILDESQKVKNASAARTKACKELCIGVRIVYALTGTPVENRPSEFASQLEIIRQLDQFGGMFQFLNRFCNPHGFGKKDRWGRFDYSGANHILELNQRLKDSCYLRRLKGEVLKDLPPKTRSVIPLSIENTTSYRTAEEDVVRWIESTLGDEAAERAKKAEALVQLEVLKKLAVDGKLEAAIQWIGDFLESGEKLVVFTTHRHVARAVANKFKCGVIEGATPIETRNRIVASFHDDPSVNMIVLNIQAGGIGLNLQVASNVVILELPWNPAQIDQAEDRTHRIGQSKPVNIWYLIASGTIEETIYDLIEHKRRVVKLVTDGGTVDEEMDVIRAVLARLGNRQTQITPQRSLPMY